MTSDNHIVVLGAGQAGGTACAMLRQQGWDGPITLIGEEAAPPYQRPPLSKAYLKGEMDEARLYLKPTDFYDAQSITLRLGVRAAQIDRNAKTVSLSDGEKVGYAKLILATGSRPRHLPVAGADLDGVLTLRTLADVEDLRPRAVEGKTLVVIGAGYIGLEAAAVARQMGMDVVVLEAMDRVLARVTGPIISEFFQDRHRAEGVDLRLQAKMDHFVGEDGKLAGVALEGGEVIGADIALVGIGIVPNQELAEAAGIACQDGIVTDARAQTSDPDIFAIGDCVRRPIVQYKTEGRLESVHNALEGGKIAAAAICDKPQPKLDAPWFWSDQYDIKLQTAGLFSGYDQMVLRGDPASGGFSVYYLKDGTFLAVDAVNAPPDFLMGKKMVGAGAKLDPDQLADLSVPIKDIVMAALNG